jgi:hypothetical protein
MIAMAEPKKPGGARHKGKKRTGPWKARQLKVEGLRRRRARQSVRHDDRSDPANDLPGLPCVCKQGSTPESGASRVQYRYCPKCGQGVKVSIGQ